MKQKSSSLFIIISLVVIFTLGFFVGKNTAICPVCPPEDVDFSLLWEAWYNLESSYVNPNDLDSQKMVYGAISGMVGSLGDPYTVFFNPEEAKTFLEDVSGEFEGVGMEIGIRDDLLKVIAPLEGTPADKAGLRPGDIIVKIGDVSALDITIEEAVTLIRGTKGTEVILTILREGWNGTKEFKIERAVIKVPSMKWELLDNDIAHIKLYHFSEKANKDFNTIAYEILDSSAKKLILDLRSNPGGYLERAQDIAGWFLAKDQIVVIEDFGDKQEKEIYYAQGNGRFKDYLMVILINEGSASASEILASAIRDNRGVKLIGKTSFGKGSVQKLQDLSDGSSLKITIAKWLTPNNNLIHDIGLNPDIEVEFTEEDYDEEKDPQLDKAIEILKEMN